MRRHVALTIGLCLLPLGLVAEPATAQIPTTMQAGPSEDALQDAQQPTPPSTDTTVKAREAQPRERTPTPPKDERAQKEQAETRPRMVPPADEAAHNGPNVRVELTLTDQMSGAAAMSKTVILTTSNSNWGRLRSEVRSNVTPSAPLNVDARPTVLPDGRISLQVTIEYGQSTRKADGDGSLVNQASLNESMTVLLENGKALMITQSADPNSDRKVTVEVKATVLK